MSNGQSLPVIINGTFGAVGNQAEEGSLITPFSPLSDCSTKPSFYVPVEKVGDGIECEMSIDNCSVGQYGLTGNYAFNINNQMFIVTNTGIIPTGREFSVNMGNAVEI